MNRAEASGNEMAGADLSACDREPIHVIGSIQPFGALVAADEATLQITHASANCHGYLGASAQQLVGRPLASLIGEAGVESLLRHELDPKGSMIASILEGDVIPGLLRNYAASMPVHAGSGPRGNSFDSEALLLSESLLGWRADAPQRIMEDLRGRGGNGARFAEAVLGEAARRLGEMWVEDRCSFFQVSLAMSELQSLLRAGRPETAGIGAAPAGSLSGKVVLATAPGEQHSFGVSVLEVAFAEAGWATTTMVRQPFSSLSQLLGQASFDVVALSCSCTGLLDGMKSAIGTLRRASLNPHLKVLVGGHLESQVQCFAERVGADASAGDIESALEAANSLLAQPREPAHEQAR